MIFTSFNECLFTLLSDPNLEKANGAMITKKDGDFAYHFTPLENEEDNFLRIHSAIPSSQVRWIAWPANNNAFELFKSFSLHPQYAYLRSKIAWYTAEL